MPEQFPHEVGEEYSSKLLRTSDLAAADFVIAASQVEFIEDDALDVLKTDEERLSELWQLIQEKFWFMRPEYRTAEPHEQWLLTTGNDEIPLYNYVPELQLKQEQVTRIAFNIARFASKFPSLHPQLEAITVLDMPYEDPLEDDMALTYPEAGIFVLSPYALQEGEYRPDMPVTRLDAVVTHELAHFIMDEALEPAWTDAGYTWGRVVGYSNKLHYVANRPEDCVSSYAVRGGVYEDIAESATAYILGRPSLATKKREILSQSESWLRIHSSAAHKLDQMVVPKLPEKLFYFVDYDETDTDIEAE